MGATWPPSKKKKALFLLDPHPPSDPPLSPLSPFRSHSRTCSRACAQATLWGEREKKRLACLIVFYFGVQKAFGSRRETERGLRSRGEEESALPPVAQQRMESPPLVSLVASEQRGGQRGAPGGGGGGLRGSAEDHPVVELPIFRRRQILGLNKAGTTAEDHGGCGLVALRLPRLSQGNAPGCCVLAFQHVFYRGVR